MSNDFFPALGDLVPPGAVMTVWVVYDHPTDYPDAYVARPQFVMADHSVMACKLAFINDNLDVIRDALVEAGLHCLSRMPGDDPKIMETWL
jgi:hypothetical protein